MHECSVPPSMADHGARWHALTAAVLQHAADAPRRMEEAVAAAPRSAAALAAKGLLLMLAGHREAWDAAATAHRDAQRALYRAPAVHDRALVDALGLWLAGRPSAAASRLEAWLDHAPGDAMAFKLAHAIRFVVGDAAGMRAAAEAHAPSFGKEHPFAGYVGGCLAFAREECLDYAGALSAGRRALELTDDDAWGLHAVAHVHEMTGRPREGRELIAANVEATSKCSTFANHVDWHAALFELELGDTGAALRIYDTAVRRERTDDYRDVANAASLLARVAAEGVDVGARWGELAEVAERRATDECMAFADLHYLMALLAAGRTEAASRLVDRMAGAQDGTEIGAIASGPGAAAGSGLCHFARGRYTAALDRLLAAGADLSRIGGSHAQRDVFARITVDAAVLAGRYDVATRLIDERARMRGRDRFATSRLAACSASALAS